MNDKTVKTTAFPGSATSGAVSSNLTEAQEKALDLVKKGAQLEEMKVVVQGHLNTIEQLRESLKQEQAKIAVLEEKIKGQAALEAKIKELSDVLGKISGIAATGK